MATWSCKWSFTATQPHLCTYPLSMAVSCSLEALRSYNPVWPTGPKYLLSGPLQIKCTWSLISKIVSKEWTDKKKLMQFIKWIYKIGKYFIFSIILSLGWPRIKILLLGIIIWDLICHQSARVLLKARLYSTEWFPQWVGTFCSYDMSWQGKRRVMLQRGTLLNE